MLGRGIYLCDPLNTLGEQYRFSLPPGILLSEDACKAHPFVKVNFLAEFKGAEGEGSVKLCRGAFPCRSEKTDNRDPTQN